MAQSKAQNGGRQTAGAPDRRAAADERPGAKTNFAAHAASLRRRLRSKADSTDTIRADRDRDGPA